MHSFRYESGFGPQTLPRLMSFISLFWLFRHFGANLIRLNFTTSQSRGEGEQAPNKQVAQTHAYGE